MKAFYEQDANLDFLKNKTIAVIGYGSQGHAHAQNLRDSGLNVIVGQRSGGANYALAKEHGFAPMSAAEAAAAADVIMILLPDQHQARVYREDIAPNLKPGKSLVFAHGFNIHFCQIEPPKPSESICAPASVLPIRRSPVVLRSSRLHTDGRNVPNVS